MTVKVIQNIAPITSLGTSSAQSGAFTSTSGKLRISANTDVFVEVGQNPTATTSSLYVPQGEPQVIKITKKESVGIVDVISQNSTHTTITTNQLGVQEPLHGFDVGDFVNVTKAGDTFDTLNKEITEINNNTIIIEYDSTSNSAAYSGTGVLGYSIKVAARTESATGSSVYITEVQTES